MLVDSEIMKSCNTQLKKASKVKLKVLDKEVKEIVQWAERWSVDIIDPGYEMKAVPRLIKVGNRITEVPVDRVYWGLEKANPKLLPYVDIRIIDAFKRLKKGGFDRTSTVLYGRMLDAIHTKENDEKYKGNGKAWAGVKLFFQRLYATTRIVCRLENLDMFGNYVLWHKDGSVTFGYDQSIWKDELIRRGVLPQRRKKDVSKGRKKS